MNDNGLGQTYKARAEVMFKPYTDYAYGPDDATVQIYIKNSADIEWRLYDSNDQCHVTVYH